MVADDLQHHAVGCYTAMSEIKKNNRAAEAALVTGEKLAALSSVVAGFEYPRADFTAAWKKVLFMQFHDSMAGTALPEHYEVARARTDTLWKWPIKPSYRAAEKIAWQVPTQDPDSEYLVVFNPHAWDAKLNVEYDLGWRFHPRRANRRYKAIPCWKMSTATVLPTNGCRHRRWSTTGISWCSVRRCRLLDTGNFVCAGSSLPRSRCQPSTPPSKELENEHLRVTFGEDGSLSIFDKDAGAQVFRGGAGGARAIVLDDPSDTWSHGVRAYTKEVGAFGNARFRVLENGPLRATVRVRTSYGFVFSCRPTGCSTPAPGPSRRAWRSIGTST